MKLYSRHTIRLMILPCMFLLTSTGFLKPQPDAGISEPPLNVVVEPSMPSFFEGVQPNEIHDPTNSLFPFFEKLMMLQRKETDRKPIVRILHIGDSHVRSHKFTPVLSLRLSAVFGNAAATDINGYRSSGIVAENGKCGIVCHCIGINGATSKNFTDNTFEEKLYALQPDLVIVSLGTNESLGRYDNDYHHKMMENLSGLLDKNCPLSSMLYTTPPGAFKTRYSRGGRRGKIIAVEDNTNTQYVANAIGSFAAEHNAACWDLFNIAGGNDFACKNWRAGNFYQRDMLHFIEEGYALHGNLLYEALMNAYNKFIMNRK